MILDNFPAAVAGPDPLEPRLTRGFLEYSQARGFICDPARVRKPRDKPHVEAAVKLARERLFKGGSFSDLEDCREQAERWCREVAGLRVHGTTRKLPREVFEAQEQHALQPYDGVLYDVPTWKAVTVHPDHHVQFDQALYSVPATTCPPGTKLEVRGDGALVKLYKKGELAKVHPRQPKGGRVTDPDDDPKEKTPYALRATDRIVHGASQKLLSLGEKYSGARLDAACERALSFELIDVHRLQRILLQAIEGEAQPPEQTVMPLGSRFARPGSAFDHRLQEAAR